jgi:hemerythrin HHE cation binding domain-containing protein
MLSIDSGPHLVRAQRGELYRFMKSEHERLDQLLAQAAERGGAVDGGAYEGFRERLLRHIRIEERILLPMAQHKRGGEPLAIAPRLRLDHGALAALLMLPPVDYTFHAIRAVLDAHNPLEENEGGVYQQCEGLAGLEAAALLEHARATPRMPVSRWVDSPKVVASARRVLVRAGYDPALLGPDN